MFKYKPLICSTYKEICDCVNLAFSDYEFPPKFDEIKIKQWFLANGVDLNLSFGAFSNDKLVGFIINSYNTYKGYKCVFDVATAIVPEYRGKKVFSSLFAYVEKEIKNKGIQRYYLEVLKQNDKAIKIYSNKGFDIEREYLILKTPQEIKIDDDFKNVKILDLKDFDIRAKNCICNQPSFENSTNVINCNKELFKVIYIERDKKITAFCIYSAEKGNISQFCFESIDDLKLLIKKLFTIYPRFVAKNIDIKSTKLIEMLFSLGFSESTRQFEMFKNY